MCGICLDMNRGRRKIRKEKLKGGVEGKRQLKLRVLDSYLSKQERKMTCG
jgi:hypothetical protein